MRYIAILALVFMTGCAMFSKGAADFSCPKTGFVADADHAVFPAAEALMNGFTGDCSFDKGAGSAQIDITLPFMVKKNSWSLDKKVKLPYFVAVLSPEDAILQRETFSTTIDFDNTGIGSNTEEHSVRIPLKVPAEAYKYKVVVGFALTPEQLKHNKERK